MEPTGERTFGATATRARRGRIRLRMSTTLPLGDMVRARARFREGTVVSELISREMMGVLGRRGLRAARHGRAPEIWEVLEGPGVRAKGSVAPTGLAARGRGPRACARGYF